jgi:hypothetical protein
MINNRNQEIKAFNHIKVSMKGKETRFGKLGRFTATMVNYIIGTLPEEQRNEYKSRFIAELKTYSFKGKKKEEPKNEGCVYELEDLERLDMNNPEELARTVKEHAHGMFQKNNSKNYIVALLKDLEESEEK